MDNYTIWNIFASKHNGMTSVKRGWRIAKDAYICPTKWGFTFYKDDKKVGLIYNFRPLHSKAVFVKLEEFYKSCL